MARLRFKIIIYQVYTVGINRESILAEAKQVVVHVTHEAGEKMGGIGAVLEGLFTSRTYLSNTRRSIIIGPLYNTRPHPKQRLGPAGEVLYSSLDGVMEHPYARQLLEVESKFGVRLVYGRRLFKDQRNGIESRPEVVLIDVTSAEIHPVNALKAWMWEEFGIESDKFEKHWEYEQYVKLAPAALAVLRALGVSDPQRPPILIAHEYMGLPTALAAVMDPLASFKTLFWAHEVAPVRRIVENHPGHDTMFYNALAYGRKKQYYLHEIFGPQDNFKSALVSAAHYCDNIIAVGDLVVDELHFLGPKFDNIDIDLGYNGLPAWEISLDEKEQSKARLQQYARNLLGCKPDYIFSHVTRLATSKAIWRDLRVLYHLEESLKKGKKTGVYFLLGTEGPRRGSRDIRQMEESWNWPVAHREEMPDLTGGEAGLYGFIQEFNSRCRALKIVFVNQFGWDRASCGQRMPEDMSFADLRQGTDVEFGQSIYEPFGIAHLEPLAFGGLCVVSGISGCLGYVRQVNGGSLPDNVIVADYAHSDFMPHDIKSIMMVGQQQRDQVEERVSREVAGLILERLPQDAGQAQALLQKGYELARQMDWEHVCEAYFLPAVARAYHKKRARLIA